MLELGRHSLESSPRQDAQVAREPSAQMRAVHRIQEPEVLPLASGPLRELLKVYGTEPPLTPVRATGVWLVSEMPIPEGFAGYLVPEQLRPRQTELPAGSARMVLPASFDYLAQGDIVRLNWARGSIGVLFRRASHYNTLLVTEQCNHYCLMCSQPPKRPEDRWLVEDAQQLVRMLPLDTESLGISGGEPTLLGEDLLE